MSTQNNDASLTKIYLIVPLAVVPVTLLCIHMVCCLATKCCQAYKMAEAHKNT